MTAEDFETSKLRAEMKQIQEENEKLIRQHSMLAEQRDKALAELVLIRTRHKHAMALIHSYTGPEQEQV